MDFCWLPYIAIPILEDTDSEISKIDESKLNFATNPKVPGGIFETVKMIIKGLVVRVEALVVKIEVNNSKFNKD